MPTYEYVCEGCRHEFEEFQSITAPPLRKCPRCARPRLRRLIGSGAGIIFKGSGFYETDYRSESYKKGVEAESKALPGPAKSDTAATSTDGAATNGKKTETAAPGAEGAKAASPPDARGSSAEGKTSRSPALAAARRSPAARGEGVRRQPVGGGRQAARPARARRPSRK